MAGEGFWLPSSTGTGSSVSELLGVVTYNPVGLTGFSTASSTYANVDATNLAVTFTAPASGAVIVRQEALVVPVSGGYMHWNVRSAGADVASSGVRVSGNGTMQVRGAASRRITGLTSGSSYTYTWGFARLGSGTVTMYFGAADAGPGLMEVWAA